jgi:hypothetical protein
MIFGDNPNYSLAKNNLQKLLIVFSKISRNDENDLNNNVLINSLPIFFSYGVNNPPIGGHQFSNTIFILYFFHNFSNSKRVPMAPKIFLLFLLISLCLLMMGIIADAEPDPAVEKIFLGPGRDRG